MGEQAHAANTAMSFLLHAERQWRGVADGQRSAASPSPFDALRLWVFAF